MERSGDEDDDREWRFSIDEVGPEAEESDHEDRPDQPTPEYGFDDPADGQGTQEDPEQEDERDRYEPPPIEPEPISLENALFVLLGVTLTVTVLLTAL